MRISDWSSDVCSSDLPASARTMPAPPTMHRMEDIDRVRDYLTGLQDRICAAIEAVDGQATFAADSWTREPDGACADGKQLASGGGRTRGLRGGAAFEPAEIGRGPWRERGGQERS